MLILIYATPLLAPLIMLYATSKKEQYLRLFNLLALFSIYLFGVILAKIIYTVLSDQQVFMTEIHRVLLSPLFLIAGGYFGIYLLFRLLLCLKH